MSDQRRAKWLFEQMKARQRELEDLLVRAFPVGSEVSYTHGERLRFCTVRDHSGMRMEVVGATDRPYWIYATEVLREVE